MQIALDDLVAEGFKAPGCCEKRGPRGAGG